MKIISKCILSALLLSTSVYSTSCTDKEIIQEMEQQTQSKSLIRTQASILSANSYSDISVGIYRSQSKFKYAYQHLKQKPGECSWTSYVCAVAAIRRGNGLSYEVNYPKVTRVRNACNNSSYITKIKWFAENYDDRSTYLTAPTSQFQAVKNMINHLDTYQSPFLIIGKVSGISHYRTVWSINWQGSIYNSTVYYTDTLNPTESNINNQFKPINFAAFLANMRSGSSFGGHNMLFIGN
ncbi:hypothetical protein [Bernardetia sp. MNP-M8]|uniref:hypothetical protein n=1 Tax=Bernardetia sp. MNP-M8 TaxID=3127470 RepID=UPI0030D3C318